MWWKNSWKLTLYQILNNFRSVIYYIEKIVSYSLLHVQEVLAWQKEDLIYVAMAFVPSSHHKKRGTLYASKAIGHGLRTPRESFFSKIQNFWAWADKLGRKFMRHLGYFWPNYKHYFDTVSVAGPLFYKKLWFLGLKHIP